MTKSAVTLDDKYTQRGGRVFISSNQALVRLPLDQARRDRAAGLKTAGYISGYRGSPLGVYDSALWAAQKLLDKNDIRFVPGLNEELAVSALRGTQELQWFGKSAFEGVFGLWYGKGVGVDRACESLKLGNLEGAAAKGGFLAVAGDDHGGKSSDSAHQSEHTLIAAYLPILYPATLGEIIEFGLFGWAMSRYSGSYVALKCVTDTLDLSGCVDLVDSNRPYAIPADIELPPGGLNLRRNQPPLAEEDWVVHRRLPAATAFARANCIDRVVIDGQHRTLSIVSAGKAFLDVRQALADLGIDGEVSRRLGIRLYKTGLIWPMDGQRLVEYAQGSAAVLVVEEKRPVMEDQIARHLYGLNADKRPALAGKQDLRVELHQLKDGDVFVREVAITLARLMAYKDEYEVARLYTDPKFTQRVREQFSGNFRMTFHLAPPLFPGRDPSGRPRKRAFGGWILHLFRILAALKGLRGSAFDPFGYTAERRMERRLTEDYRALVGDIVDRLNRANLPAAIELARAAAEIGGYGPVKRASVSAYYLKLGTLLQAFEAASQLQSRAA